MENNDIKKKQYSEELSELFDINNQTKRVTSKGMEEILYKVFPVLDHGFVRVVDYMGDDSSIVQAARVSYGKGTKKISEDKGLINYLMRHYHSTPFEMCEIKMHIKLPMFIARQWIRHRTANVNEYSARYSILDREFYIPKPEHLASQSSLNKQGRSDVVEGKYAQEFLEILKNDSLNAYKNYEYMLNENEEDGRPSLARELARMNLPVNFYTQWYWKIDLHNLMHFLSLRADSHAQYEIRIYAQTILDKIFAKWLPITYEAFMNYRFGGVHLSSKGLNVIKQKLAGKNITQEESGMSKREWEELMNIL